MPSLKPFIRRKGAWAVVAEDQILGGIQVDMNDRYRLIAAGNEELVSALSKLVRCENDLLSDMLAHLAELDERRLYLELGFTSMFAYCTDALGLCKSSAYRRIAAARVCRRYPEVFARVAAGELQTSGIEGGRSAALREQAVLGHALRESRCDRLGLGSAVINTKSPRPVRSGLGYPGRDRRCLFRVRIELVAKVVTGFDLTWAELAITHQPIDPDLEFASGNHSTSGLSFAGAPILER